MKPLLVGLGLLGAAAGLMPAAGIERDEPATPSTCINDQPTDRQGNELIPWGTVVECDLGIIRESECPSQNGIALRIKAKQVLVKGSNQIVVDWKVTYNGPRSPLVMLKPCLRGCHRNGDTMLAIYVVGTDGEAHRVWFCSPAKSFWLMPAAPGPGCYLAARPGQPASGCLRVSTEQVRRHLLKHRPKAFDKKLTPKAYAKLYHEPTERGEEYGLDAWTGQLESNLVPLKLERW